MKARVLFRNITPLIDDIAEDDPRKAAAMFLLTHHICNHMDGPVTVEVQHERDLMYLGIATACNILAGNIYNSNDLVDEALLIVRKVRDNFEANGGTID